MAIGLRRFIEQAAGWLDEPLRELEAMAGLNDRRGAERVLATPTLSSVPEVLDGPGAGTGGAGSRVWRYRTDVPVTGPSLPAAWGEPTAPLAYVTSGSVTGSMTRLETSIQRSSRFSPSYLYGSC